MVGVFQQHADTPNTFLGDEDEQLALRSTLACFRWPPPGGPALVLGFAAPSQVWVAAAPPHSFSLPSRTPIGLQALWVRLCLYIFNRNDCVCSYAQSSIQCMSCTIQYSTWPAALFVWCVSDLASLRIACAIKNARHLYWQPVLLMLGSTNQSKPMTVGCLPASSGDQHFTNHLHTTREHSEHPLPPAKRRCALCMASRVAKETQVNKGGCLATSSSSHVHLEHAVGLCSTAQLVAGLEDVIAQAARPGAAHLCGAPSSN